MIDKNTEAALLEATGRIVGGFAAGQAVRQDKLFDLMDMVYDRLAQKSANRAAVGGQIPAVAIDESVSDDFITCLEDGRKMTMLKRYIKTHYNMDEAEYREKWGLPADYPMVAPKYASKRARIAKKFGLGKK